jgi:hypothetical protein
MCVILIAKDRRLTPEEIIKAHYFNPEGLGIAWLNLKGELCYYKSADSTSLDNVCFLASIVPLPYAVHSRLATIGNISDDLCHPFPVPVWSKNRPKFLFFHNGTIKNWKRILFVFILRHFLRFILFFPFFIKMLLFENWSDSKAIALILSLCSSKDEMLKLLDDLHRKYYGAFVLLSEEDINLWGMVEKDGIEVSDELLYDFEFKIGT